MPSHLSIPSRDSARAATFAVLVFAELLRSFGARSEIQAIWRIDLFSTVNLVADVAVSLGLRVWSRHNATLGRILKTSYLPFADRLGLVALGAIPLLVLEAVKVFRHHRTQTRAPAAQ